MTCPDSNPRTSQSDTNSRLLLSVEVPLLCPLLNDVLSLSLRARMRLKKECREAFQRGALQFGSSPIAVSWLTRMGLSESTWLTNLRRASDSRTTRSRTSRRSATGKSKSKRRPKSVRSWKRG